MSLEIEAINPATVTYADARAISVILAASFAGEPYAKLLWGPAYDFLHHPPVGAAHARAFGAYLRVEALSLLRTLRGPVARGFFARKAGHIAGFALWIPAPASTAAAPKPSVVQRIRTWWTGVQLAAWNWWYFGRGRSPVVRTPEFLAFTRRGGLAARTQFEDDAAEAARRAELAHLSPDELARTPYPEAEAHFCAIMSVAPAYQRQGVGRKLFVESAKSLPVHTPEFSDGQGTSVRAPVQYLLHATQPGAPLYRSVGFSSVNQLTETVEGVEATLDLFLKSGPF